VDVTWVDARGRVVTSDRASPEARAIVGGLGLLGVVTEMTLQLGPPSHTRFESVWKRDDDAIVEDILGFLKETPRMLVVWRPDMGKYTAIRLVEAPLSEPLTGATQNIELPELAANAFGATIKTWEVRGACLRGRGRRPRGRAGGGEPHATQGPPAYAAPLSVALCAAPAAALPDTQEMARPPALLDELMCAVSAQVSITHGWANNLRGRVVQSGVGRTNEMQAVGCGRQCAWEADIANLAMWDTHFTADASALPGWVTDVKAIMAKDFWRPWELRRGRCLPPGYIWLRFGAGNDGLIAPAAGLNATVHLQMSFMMSRASAPRWGIKHGHVLETLEQLTLCK
jgi:L-gulonolactone oxidase